MRQRRTLAFAAGWVRLTRVVDDPHRQDRQLVERCLAFEPFGDTSGAASPWDAFVGQWTPFLRREIGFALRKFGSRDDAALIDDLLQQVFQTLVQDRSAALRNFRWNTSLQNYLAIIATTRTFNALRRKDSARPLDAAGWGEAAGRLLGDEREAAPSRRLEQAELEERLRQGLLRLSERERLALQLHYWDELPVGHLSRLFGLQQDSVRSVIHRARERLRELLRGAPFCI